MKLPVLVATPARTTVATEPVELEDEVGGIVAIQRDWRPLVFFCHDSVENPKPGHMLHLHGSTIVCAV